MTATTVGGIIDRVLREALRPAAEQPAVVFLSGALDASSTSFVVDTSTLAVDELGVLTPGIVVECELELMFVTDVTVGAGTSTLTVKRGWEGTTAATHAQGTRLTASPDFPRVFVFDALGAEMVALYPHVWGVASTAVSTSSTYAEVPEDLVSVEHYRWYASDTDAAFHQAAQVQLLRNYTPSSTGQAIMTPGLPAGKAGILTYRKKFTRPTAEADLLTDLDIQEDWHDVLVWGTAARVVMPIDAARLSVEWVTETQEGEQTPAGTSTALASRWRRMADAELRKAEQRWRTQHPITVEFSNPFRPWDGPS